MGNYNITGFNGLIIFDKNNPNFIITNTDEEISELFKNKHVPILAGNNGIIGFVKDVEFWTGEKLIGDVLIWDVSRFSTVFENYEVFIDDNKKITKICSIKYEEKDTE